MLYSNNWVKKKKVIISEIAKCKYYQKIKIKCKSNFIFNNFSLSNRNVWSKDMKISKK